jgi:hypothetical protein
MGSVRKRRFKDNDVIRIPAYSQRVTIEGAGKRPGIFEMKQSRFLIYYHLPQDLLSLPTASVNASEKPLKNSKCRILLPLSSKVINRFLVMCLG